MKTFSRITTWLAGFTVATVLFFTALPWLGLADMPPPAVPEPPTPETPPEDSARSRSAAASRPPPQKQVAASFEVVEAVSAKGSVAKEQREALDQFAFPPMNFRWTGKPEALAPAFLWEDADGRLHLGAQLLSDLPEGSAAPQDYSSKLAIRFKGQPGRLRLHFNVIARLKAWAEEVAADIGKAAPIEVRIEVPTPDRVILQVPAVGKTSSRTFVVSV